MGKSREFNASALRFTLMKVEPHRGGCTHFDGSDAAFGVPLGEVPVPAEYTAPATLTGMNNRDPLVSCFASTLPQFSRGGMVLRPC